MWYGNPPNGLNLKNENKLAAFMLRLSKGTIPEFRALVKNALLRKTYYISMIILVIWTHGALPAI